MLRSCFLLLLPMLAFGFNPLGDASKTGVKIRGSTKPLEKFDPLGLSSSNTDDRILFFREAELKHGRIAMISSLLIPFFDKMDPSVLGIHGFNHLSIKVQLLIISHMFMAEIASIFKGWEKPFSLKSGYQPGDLGFQLFPTSDEEMNILMDKELNNGRLAMIGVLGMIAQQLVTQQHLF